MAKSQEWKTNSTTIENGRIKVSGAAKYVKDGTNKLSTFTANNTSGRVPLDSDSSNSIVSTTFYSVDSNGFVDFYRQRPNGTFKKYESIQEIADAGIFRYNNQTTKLLKNSLQSKLSTSATKAKIPGAANPDKSVNNDGNTENDGLDSDNGGSDGSDNNVDASLKAPSNKPTGSYRYPLNIGSESARNLDKIRFTQGEYKGISLGETPSIKRGIPERQYDFASFGDSSVTIGIQPQISDSNSVKWNGSNLNSIRGAAALLSLNAIQSKNAVDAADQIGDALTQLKNDITKDDNIGRAMSTYFAGKAVGMGGGQLLSRVNGAVLNPNLELLFEGPDLRQFNYTFKMSAESSAEAAGIKNIIGWFKRGMAVRRASGNLFLNTPNIFKIQYLKGEGDGNHDGLNMVKECALLNVQTNYTPEGNYSTFEDGTMTMYDLTLSFGELTPIIASDYDKLAGQIGY